MRISDWSSDVCSSDLCTKFLREVVDYDEDAQEVTVQPGIVLDHLNAWLKPKGRLFPVDVSTASRATIGGMTANNSCGGRSIHYGIMVDNVEAIDRSEEHTSELQSLMSISYAVFC